MTLYVDIILRYLTNEAFFASMTALTVPNNPSARYEEQLGVVSTPATITHQGVVRMVRLWLDQVALIPDIILSPETVLIDWRSDEDIPIEEVSYTADLTDADGNLYVGVVMPGVIAS